MATATVYRPRIPEENPIYGIVAGYLETFLARQRERDRHVPVFVEREFREFLNCGVLARGFIRVHCDDCGLDRLVAFSCKKRAVCNSCSGRNMSGCECKPDRAQPSRDVGYGGAFGGPGIPGCSRSRSLQIAESARIELLADVFNVRNRTAEEGLVDDNLFSQNFGRPNVFIDPRRAMLGVRFVFGR